MIRLVLFDFDMTLVDSSHAIHHCTNKLAEHFGLRKVSYEELLAAIGLPIVKCWSDFWGEYKLEWHEYYRAHFGEKEDAIMQLFPNTVSTLEGLRELGIKVAVASNRTYAERPIGVLELNRYLDGIMGLKEGINPKPAPDILNISLAKHKVTKDEAIYVGDTDIDIKTAKNAGMKVVGMTTGNFSREDMQQLGADWICDDLSEILGIVKEYSC